MIALPGLLIDPAREAGMSTPEDADNFDPAEFPHFAVFCAYQLGRVLESPSGHWKNARVIAALTDDEARDVSRHLK